MTKNFIPTHVDTIESYRGKDLVSSRPEGVMKVGETYHQKHGFVELYVNKKGEQFWNPGNLPTLVEWFSK